MYLSVFTSVKALKLMIYGTMILVVIFHTAFMLEVIFICQPIHYVWEMGLTGTKGKCPVGRDAQMAVFIPSVLSLIVDVVIFV